MCVQLLNVYSTQYDSGGRMWPIVHNTTIFSLVLTQIIALGVFGMKKAPFSSTFTVPLIFITLLFNLYCKKNLYPIFKKFSAQDFIDMDREDELAGRMPEIHGQVLTAYSQQLPRQTLSQELCFDGAGFDDDADNQVRI
ncbi:CSC1-like protein RXW8 [Canna indica]|uniref:CSC1-like protein RXW8 n=1 Tax=Canna indica TaxID=4628 RepID=A0AAQ3QPP3_9LILI|nr:CSC1-like protein RXW8 [Canna indica]